MLTTYDADADALYVQFSEHAVSRTDEVGPDVFIDVDSEGAAVGVEVLHPARPWSTREILNRYRISAEDRALFGAMFPDTAIEGHPAPFSQVAQYAEAV
ncbi:MAG TPA: DUF2283 domain-containing protein [Mycobacteriales bacterium]|nr:DUF2283 domain-containing protein [Mycobacteriales bacterium]